MKRLIYLKNEQLLDLIVSPLKNDQPLKKEKKKMSSPIYLGPKKSRPRYISAQKKSFAIELTGQVELKNKEKQSRIMKKRTQTTICTCTCLCVDAMLACRLCLIHIVNNW